MIKEKLSNKYKKELSKINEALNELTLEEDYQFLTGAKSIIKKYLSELMKLEQEKEELIQCIKVVLESGSFSLTKLRFNQGFDGELLELTLQATLAKITGLSWERGGELKIDE